MALKVASMPSMRCALALAVFFTAMLISGQSKSTPPAGVFDEKAASQMLLQMSEALQGHSQKQFLALFDLEKMQSGALFKQQISLFYSQTESIRVHMNLGEITTEDGNITISVDAEIEAEPRNGGPMAHQNESLTFSIVNSGGWKFTDVQPRSFFSLP